MSILQAMPILGEATLGEFKSSIGGELIGPEDAGYEMARKVWNGMIDKRPALIARCVGVADVISAVQFARSQNLLIAVRGGGHSFAGFGVCDGGLVIDLSPMKGIRVDPVGRTVCAQGGVTWGEFDRETAAFGLATTGGMVSSTGIAGLTLGGGIGWLMRKHGLSCDNLLSVDVVTADGRFLTASATAHPDLFWALQGGGGNFGVVTSLVFQLHPVQTVLGGVVFHAADRAPEVLRFYREYLRTASDELTTMAVFLTAPPAPFLPANLHGSPLVGIVACHMGGIEEREQATAPLRRFGPPLVDLLGPMPYTALQTMFDAGAPPGLHNYLKSEYLGVLSDEAIATITDHAARTCGPLSAVHIHQMGGAVSRVPAGTTAFSHRSAPFAIKYISVWSDPEETERQVQWACAGSVALQPFTTGGVYVNFLADEGEDRLRAAYGGETYERLVALKSTYDPTNLFRMNQNIKPQP